MAQAINKINYRDSGAVGNASNAIKGSRCFLEQETLPSLLSTGWFQEQIGVQFYNQTKIN